jgi:hypothetical protein
MDVVIGNGRLQRTRIWLPGRGAWQECEFPVKIVSSASTGRDVSSDMGVRFGVFRDDGMASFLVSNEHQTGIWHFDGQSWVQDPAMKRGLSNDGQPLRTADQGIDEGVRLRDIDGDGHCEIIISNPTNHAVLVWDDTRKTWQSSSASFPRDTPVVDPKGRDAGLRFVDLDADGHDDIIFSNEQRYAVHRCDPELMGWSLVRGGSRDDADAVPMIVRSGSNNGAWFADRHMWLQNEDTHRLPDGVDRRSYRQLLGDN